MQIIPRHIDPSDKFSATDFTRDNKFTFAKLITFILSIVASGKGKGVEVKSAEFFRNARRSGLWPDAKAIARSTFTKARRKVSWQIFERILNDAICLAYEYWPDNPRFSWHGMSVFGIDGSRYTLPATDEIRREFDPDSGLQTSGKGHYPQCLVTTVFDVFRKIPIARSIAGVNCPEREEAKRLIPYIPAGSILLFDRGYPSYEFILHLLNEFNGYFVFRCPARGTFAQVVSFIEGGAREDEIWITPSGRVMSKVPPRQRKKLDAIRLRVIRIVSPDGTKSVLLTNLHNRVEFPKDEITALYFKRWEIEGHYRDEKIALEIEKFHGKTPNSIRQELLAASIMTVISRSLMVLSSEILDSVPHEPQFKNAVMTLAAEVAVLVAEDPETAYEIFESIMKEIDRVRYYRSPRKRPPQPRFTKAPLNKWAYSKSKKVANA
jgi:hypothetical protein